MSEEISPSPADHVIQLLDHLATQKNGISLQMDHLKVTLPLKPGNLQPAPIWEIDGAISLRIDSSV